MTRAGLRGFSLLDLLVVVALLALLVYAVRLNWPPRPVPEAPRPVAAPAAP